MWVVYYLAVCAIVVGLLVYSGLRMAQKENVWRRVDADTKTNVRRDSRMHGSEVEQAEKKETAARAQKAKSEKSQMWGDMPRAKWDENNYCWIVFCKNRWFHWRQNLFYRHRILLGETDEVSPPPEFKGAFLVKCDNCGKEYTYKRRAVLRHEEELPEGFTPHPLFR